MYRYKLPFKQLRAAFNEWREHNKQRKIARKLWREHVDIKAFKEQR
jgi:hypothetical protein